MTVVQKVEKFQDILKIFKTTDFISGVFLFRDRPNGQWTMTKDWTLREKIARINFLMYPFVSCILMYGTIYSKRYSTLLGLIFVSSRLAIDTTVWTMLFCCVRKREKIGEIFDWCVRMYSAKKTFHSKVQEVAHEKLLNMHQLGRKLLKVFLWSFHFNVFCMVIGITMIGFFLPDNIYPKLSLPLPYFLPFKQQNSWPVYMISLVVQINYSIVSGSQTIVGLAIIYIISLYIVIYLEIIYRSIGLMKTELEQLLTEQTFERQKKPGQEVEQWVPILVQMICDVKEVLDGFNEIFSFFFLLMDYCCCGGVFTFGLLVIVVKQQVIYGSIASLLIVVVFFTLNIISVTIMHKFSQISEAIYDLPWYELEPTERKRLYHMMFCSQYKIGLNSSLRRLELENFTQVMKAAYVNGLVLKKLVTT